jgi:hypothetical protein
MAIFKAGLIIAGMAKSTDAEWWFQKMLELAKADVNFWAHDFLPQE